MFTRWEDDAAQAEEAAGADNLQSFVTDCFLTDDLDNDWVRTFLTVALEYAVDWNKLTDFFTSRHE